MQEGMADKIYRLLEQIDWDSSLREIPKASSDEVNFKDGAVRTI
jgi:hypothetical protein